MGKPWISSAHRIDQRRNHLRLDSIREMPCIGDVRKSSPAIRNFLVFGKDVGDQRKRLQILGKGLGKRL